MKEFVFTPAVGHNGSGMKWSWKLGRLAGIDVFMHVTFLLLLVWVGLNYYLDRQSLTDALYGLVFITILFGIVVLHELGHALTARRFGIATRDITLLPIGGVARLERMPEDPRQELLVALAGPAVNIALAAALALFLGPTGTLAEPQNLQMVGGNFLVKMFWVNIVLAVFNLIPAFPMDGGRVLRALLALRLDYVRATEIAATTGQVLALLFGFVGLFSNPFLVFIALFVWMGAAGEASMVQMRTALRGIPVSHLMMTDFQTLSDQDRLSSAVNHILAGSQQDFPVLDRGVVVGVLTRSRLMSALASQGQDGYVTEVMDREFQVADPAEMAQSAFQRLQECECRTLPVVRDGRLLGIVNSENLGEFLLIRKALHRHARTG